MANKVNGPHFPSRNPSFFHLNYQFYILRPLKFFKNFYFLMNFRTSFTSYWENRTVFRPKKCIFCETNFAGEEKIQKKLIFAIFFFQMAKKSSEKLKCNDLFYFYSFLPPKKWGNPIESLLTFP